MIGSAPVYDTGGAQHGFTLLELLVVCVLVALTLSIAVPNVRSLYHIDPLTQSARLVEQTVARARSTAIEQDNQVRVSIDAAAGTLAIHPAAGKDADLDPMSGAGYQATLPERVVIVSIWIGSVERDKGDAAAVWINERGMIEPLIINIGNGGRVMGISFSPFVPVEISDHEVVPIVPGFARIN